MEVLNEVSVVSLIITAVVAVVAFAFAIILGKSRSLTDKLIIAWLLWDVAIHFCLEGPFVYFSLIGTVNKSTHWLAEPWKEYARADKRWGVSDPNIVSLKILTVLLGGLLCIVLIFAIIKDRSYRHCAQIVLCVCELYGGWMTFAPEWLTGSPNVVTDNWLYLWVYLIFFNGLWVIVPLLLLCQSWFAVSIAFKPRVRKEQPKEKPAPKPKYYTRASKSKTKHA